MKPYYKYTNYNEVLDFKRLDYIIQHIQSLKKEGLKVLDVGCGNGNISRAIASLGYTVKGIDLSSESIETAKKLNTFDNASFECIDAEKFVGKEAFDVIVCSEVIEHLNHPEVLLKTISQIISPDGIVIITVPNGYGPREFLVTKPVQKLNASGFAKVIVGLKRLLGYKNAMVQSNNPDLTHIQFFTKGSLKQLVSQFNLSIQNFGHADFIEHVFPISILYRRVKLLQKFDNSLANHLPSFMVSGFYSVWKLGK
jgi:2-polyprenyl-3-methyl-5-hydroxy-6-metoxy-1,4-benzoquinol methylase